MSGSNPFDDMGKAQGGNPLSYREAATEMNKKGIEVHELALRSPEQTPPALITGEEYTDLKPQSLQLTQQDLLDDRRFKDISRPHVSELPDHQERVRAAKAICRRSPLDDDTFAEIIVDTAEHKMRIDQRKAAVIIAVWVITGVCFLWSLVISETLFVAAPVAFLCYFLMGGLIRVASFFVGLDKVSGRAV